MSTVNNTLQAVLLATAMLTIGANQAAAQCMRGRGDGRTTTGSTGTLARMNSTSARSTGNPTLLMMQRVAQVQNQTYVMAYQMAARQTQLRAARNAQAMPYRLARAEANRAARAERIAARLREQDRIPDSGNSYALVSTTSRSMK